MARRTDSVRIATVLSVIIGALFLVAGGLIVVLVNQNMHVQARAEAEAKMRVILDRNLAVHSYFSEILKPNLFAYTEPFRSDDDFDPSWMSSSFAVREMGNYFETLSPEDYYYKDAAINARSPENEADAEERAFLEDLKNDPSLEERSSVRTIDGEPYLVVLRPGEVLVEECLRCHADPADAPADLVRQYGAERSFHREAELGNVASAVSVRVPLAVAYARVDRVSLQLTALLAVILSVVFAIVFWLPRRYVFSPLGMLRDKALEISSHDEHLGERIPVPVGQELGTLTEAFNAMSTSLLESRDHLETRVAARTTELEESEQALRQSESLLREAQALSQLGSYALDVPAGVWTSSDMLDVLFGIGMTYERSIEGWLALVHPADREMMSEYMRGQVLGRGEVFDREYRIVRHADQAERWVYGLGRLEFDGKGLPVRMFGTIQDITARKRSEEALRESEERLLQSQRMEVVGNLAGGIAHDFNNLLTALIGQTEMLRDDPGLSAEQRDGLTEIRTVADRAASLTRQLLAFSRRQTLQPRVLDLNEIAESMTNLLTRLLGQDIDLIFRGEPHLWPIEADPGQLEQVIMNLAVNARDAMPDGGTLAIETANVEVDEDFAAAHAGLGVGPHVLLAVSDTGEGIETETQARIFEPFFSTKEPGKGTGLGLSTAYGIVKQSEGSIWVDSVPGVGSTFNIYVPRAQGPIDWSPTMAMGQVGTVPVGNETILVVEDEPSVRQLTTRVLSRRGYSVLGVGSSEEAIALVNGHSGTIDLILSDIVLPGKSGPAMVDLLLSRPGFAPRVLLMSGYARDVMVQEGRMAEGVPLLEKPFTPDGLLSKVREVLDAPPTTRT